MMLGHTVNTLSSIASITGVKQSKRVTSSIATGEILSLYRSLLRTARQFSDYNIREYTRRRTINGFRQNQKLTDPASISAAYSDGKAQLEVVKRQAVVYSLYQPKIRSVMEV